jgi:hypothetical protein
VGTTTARFKSLAEELESEKRYNEDLAGRSNERYLRIKELEEKLAAINAMTMTAAA